ncbi:MAG: methyltransferase domain-containing protein [Gemmatimonadales bacterium]
MSLPWADLLLGRASLSRVLGDRVLARAGRDVARPGARVLLAGAGRRQSSSEELVLRALGPSPAVTWANLDPGRYPHVAADLAAGWPFREGSFDVVVATWVIEHLAEPPRFFAEAHRVLSSGGAFIGAVPFLYRIHASPDDFWRFTEAAVTHLGQTAGFWGVVAHPIGGGPFSAGVNLLWPLLRIPAVALIAYAVAWFLDSMLAVATLLLGKGGELANAYPMGYVVVMRKK